MAAHTNYTTVVMDLVAT